MIVPPYTKRKASVLAIYQPPSRDILPSEPSAYPSSFGASILLPGLRTDLIIHDDDRLTPARDESNFLIQGASPRRQHEWRVRTVPDESLAVDYATARDRAFILDVIHPYVFWELKQIIQEATSAHGYRPTAFPDAPIYPFRYRVQRVLPWRATHRWTPHTGVARTNLVAALRNGVADLAQQLWCEVGQRFEATGHVSPDTYDDRRVQWEWQYLTKPRHCETDDDPPLTLDELAGSE